MKNIEKKKVKEKYEREKQIIKAVIIYVNSLKSIKYEFGIIWYKLVEEVIEKEIRAREKRLDKTTIL